METDNIDSETDRLFPALDSRPESTDRDLSHKTSKQPSADDSIHIQKELKASANTEKPASRTKYETHVKKISIIKNVSILLIVVAVIVITVFYIRKMKRETKDNTTKDELDFDADEIAANTAIVSETANLDGNQSVDPRRALEDLNPALIQSETYKDPHNQQKDKTVDNEPQSTFEMPKFEIGGGVLARTRTENDIKQSQPRYRSFVGFDRSHRGTEANLDEAELSDANLGMFGRGQGKQLQKIKPRLTLAMKTQMTEAQIDALVNQTVSDNASMSQAQKVLEGIEEMKSKSKKKSKHSKSKK